MLKKSLNGPNGPFIHSFHFSSLWFISFHSVQFGPFWSPLSIHSLIPFQFTLVYFVPFRPVQSILVHSIHFIPFCLLWSIYFHFDVDLGGEVTFSLISDFCEWSDRINARFLIEPTGQVRFLKSWLIQYIIFSKLSYLYLLFESVLNFL